MTICVGSRGRVSVLRLSWPLALSLSLAPSLCGLLVCVGSWIPIGHFSGNQVFSLQTCFLCGLLVCVGSWPLTLGSLTATRVKTCFAKSKPDF